MKRILLIVLVLLTIRAEISAQHTPESALYFTSWINQSIPAILTDSSFGPSTAGVNYGNLGSNNRYAWTLIPVCDSNLVEIRFLLFNSGVDSLGYAVYGPFQDTVNITNKLQNVSPVASRAYSNGPLNFIFLPQSGRGIYYIAWSHSHFTGIKSITGSIFSPQAVNNLCGLCDAAFDLQQSICLITVDSATQKNQLIWEKGDTNNLEGFIIFRENSIAGQFDSLTFIQKDSAGTFIDYTANPGSRNWRYMMHRLDQCGTRLPVYYQGGGYIFRTNTIHLQQGISTNNTINLIWNNSINNVPLPGDGGFIQSFFIYRGNGISPMVCIDSVPITNSSYTDINPNQGLNEYQVAMRKITSCNANGLAVGQSVSNKISTVFTGLNDQQAEPVFTISPNPARWKFRIESSQNADWEVKIYSISGRLVFTQNFDQLNAMEVNCEEFEPGLYTLEIKNSARTFFKKLIIK